jgi:CDP-6-deoxy-D-xylo-4-hexulose-3-dehydrase
MRRNNAKVFKQAFSDIKTVHIQTEVGESSWFGFSLVLQGVLENRRSEVIAKLTSAGVETRPIVAGNFVKNPVIKHLNHEVRGSLKASEYIDANGFFMGNDARDLSYELTEVANIIRKIV